MGADMNKPDSRRRSFSPMHLLVCGVVVIAGCARTPPPSQPDGLVSFVDAPATCDVVPADPSRLKGSYLRAIGGAQSVEIMLIEGGKGKNALTPSVRIDENPIAVPLVGAVSSFFKARPGQADPIASLPVAEAGPKAYLLRYQGKDLAYAGPAVVGTPPMGADIPQGGADRFAGPIDLTITLAEGDPVRVVGQVEILVGYSSAVAHMVLGIDDPQAIEKLGFSTLEWAGLGLCGPRIVSTGLGRLTVRDEQGRIVLPFGGVADPSTLQPHFDATLYSDLQSGQAGPAWVGGVLAITSDTAGLAAPFLSKAQN